MAEIIKAIVYGIVEGITEWLPISSTGHLILLEQLIPFKETSPGFFGMFDVVIQLGAILAVVVLFWKQIWPFALTKKERGDKTGLMSFVKMDIMNLWFRILVSCVPAAVVGILFEEVFTVLFYNPVSIAIALIVFGIAFIVIETINKDKNAKISSLSEITYQTAVWIGVFQVIAAVFPGTSRSGATILGALLIGVSRKVASEYTFFLAIPVMFGASLLKILKFGLVFTDIEMACLVFGCGAAFIISYFVLQFLLDYIKKHDFKVFGWYRIALGVLVLVANWVMF